MTKNKSANAIHRIGSQDVKSNPALNYRLNKTRRVQLGLLTVPTEYGPHVPVNQLGVVDSWKQFAEEAWHYPLPEAKIPCWRGHLEQFGRVMLYLAQMCHYEQYFNGTPLNDLGDIMPSSDQIGMLYEGPLGSEERVFYRAWFRLIGHPEFQFELASRSDKLRLLECEFLLALALDDFNRGLKAGAVLS